MFLITSSTFFISEIGYDESNLGSFSQALKDAGIEEYNLVEDDSILLLYYFEFTQENGFIQLCDGQIVYAPISKGDSNEYNYLITISICIVIIADSNNYCHLNRYYVFGINPE